MDPSSSETVSQCLELLRTKDDTSHFVALAIIWSLLNRIDRQDPLLSTLWGALDPSFLDRLLKSSDTNKSSEEVEHMRSLAVHVVHAFAVSLPNAAENMRLIERSSSLISVLGHISQAEIPTVLETILVLATGEKGAPLILAAHGTPYLIHLAKEHPVVIQVLQYSLLNSSASPTLVRLSLKTILPLICDALEHADPELRLNLFALLNEILSRLPVEVLPHETAWVKSVLKTCVLTTQVSADNQKEWFYRVVVVASLLHAYPSSLFFESVSSESLSATGTPYVYLYLQLTTVDLRAAFPSLLEEMSSTSYSMIAQRLAADFDVVTAFLGYIMDSDDAKGLTLDPDMLLKLRNDLCDTFGLTIEFLRDRWDTATGADEPVASTKAPKALRWHSDELVKDPVVIGAVRALSLWLKEDESLRKEAGGLMDVFLGFWVKGREVGIDYRRWVLGALEGVLDETHGQEMFLEHGGRELLWSDIKETYHAASDKECSSDDILRLAIDEAMILADLARSMRVEARSWAMDVIRLNEGTHTNDLGIELDAALLHLQYACLANLSTNDLRQLDKEIERMKEVGNVLKMAVEKGLVDSYVMDLVNIVEE